MYIFSMLCLEQEIEHLSLSPTKTNTVAVGPVSPSSTATTHAPTATTKSAPTSPTHDPHHDVGYRDGRQSGFFEGLLGCLRPVWTIIGKATQAELKQQGEQENL